MIELPAELGSNAVVLRKRSVSLVSSVMVLSVITASYITILIV